MKGKDFLNEALLFLLSRRWLYPINAALYRVALAGMGVGAGSLRLDRNFLRRFSKNLPPDAVIFDVGANVGLYSEYCRRLLPEARIYAFEPQPHTFEQLRSRGLRCDFSAFKLALSDARQSGVLFDTAESGGTGVASLYRGAVEIFSAGDGPQSFSVELETLDSFSRENALERIHLLKMDVEGNELRVLEGSRETIKRGLVDFIQFEFGSCNVFSRTFFKDFYDLLAGYTFYRILYDGRLVPLGKYKSYRCEIFLTGNTCAVRCGLDVN